MKNDRYIRQMLLEDDFGFSQERLGRATVFIAGAGGLGSPAAYYLAAAGVGRIIICDNDEVETSNLNRQILHSTNRIGQRKTESAAETLRAFNPEITIKPKDALISGDPAGLIEDADLIIDCLDNIEARYVINDYSIRNGVPIVHGGINGYAGQISFIAPPETACIRCIFPQDYGSEDPIPVIGATAGLIGSLQAIEAVKYLTCSGALLKNQLYIIDSFSNESEKLQLEKNPDCPACGRR
ncbi:MAG: HesA/MoeB/ThiF family protein [Spirochaetales bacterium]|uniref:HesA/MoeB/ThiF family protein n=1 Tax=Candidatus Thalassospirochaeta sargassi TaxID=3119039 RepID=A0AAJ1MMG6_9SPIO|nr:HesA/MoeB/ThiF family protein [Spirochaetales bacterium]